MKSHVKFRVRLSIFEVTKEPDFKSGGADNSGLAIVDEQLTPVVAAELNVTVNLLEFRRVPGGIRFWVPPFESAVMALLKHCSDEIKAWLIARSDWRTDEW